MTLAHFGVKMLMRKKLWKFGIDLTQTTFQQCFKDVMKIHPPRQIMDYREKEDHPYILGFDTPKYHMEAPPSMSKDLNLWYEHSGLLMCSPLPKEPNRHIDVKLGKRFKSSKWWDRSSLLIFLHLSSFILEDLNLLSPVTYCMVNESWDEDSNLLRENTKESRGGTVPIR